MSDSACGLASQLLSWAHQPGIKVYPTTKVRHEKNTQVSIVARPNDIARCHHLESGFRSRFPSIARRGHASGKSGPSIETADSAAEPG
jgi:hypothetical protein